MPWPAAAKSGKARKHEHKAPAMPAESEKTPRRMVAESVAGRLEELHETGVAVGRRRSIVGQQRGVDFGGGLDLGFGVHVADQKETANQGKDRQGGSQLEPPAAGVAGTAAQNQGRSRAA